MNDYVEFLQDTFKLLGKLSMRKMFGAYGVYYQGLMIALIDDNVLYLKTDGCSKELFEKKQLPQFEYNKQSKIVKLSYYQAPDEIYDDPEVAVKWGTIAYEAALRSAKNK